MDLNPQPPTPPSSQKKIYESPIFIVSCIIIVVAIVMLVLPVFLQKQTQTEVTQTQTTTPPLTLTIDSPTDETVATDDVIEIKGRTLPNTTIAYYTDNSDGTVESDAQGNFVGTIALIDGINTLTITAFSDAGEEKTIAMTIVYDSQTQANAQ